MFKRKIALNDIKTYDDLQLLITALRYIRTMLDMQDKIGVNGMPKMIGILEKLGEELNDTYGENFLLSMDSVPPPPYEGPREHNEVFVWDPSE